MTGPSRGYPDFQAAGNVVSNDVPINTGITSPHVGFTDIYNNVSPSFTAVLLSFTDTSNFGQLRISGTSFDSLGITYYQDVFTYVGGGYRILIPIRGAGLHIEVGNVSAVGGGFWSGSMVGSFTHAPQYRWPNPPNFVSSGNVSVPANSTSRFALPFVQPGPAQVFFNTGAAAGQMGGAVGVFNADGSVGDQIAEVDPLNFTSNNQVYLPAAPAWVALFNTTAGALNGFARMDAVGGLF